MAGGAVHTQRHGPVQLKHRDGSNEDRLALVTRDLEVRAPSDIMVAVDGEPIETVEDLTLKVTYGSAVGDLLDITVVRGAEQINVSVTLEVGQADPAA